MRTSIARMMCVTAPVFAFIASSAIAGPEWIEGNIGRAGKVPETAQPTGGQGELGGIGGDLEGTVSALGGEVYENYEDMYLIRIDDPSAFFATTVPADGYAAFDTQLWLFSLDGRGILGNDDTLPDGGPDTPGCAADVSTDNDVSTCDLLMVINRWGANCGCCLEDIDGNGTVGVADLLAVINAWGPAPGCVLTGSTLRPVADDGTNQTIPGPGLYYLAVSSGGSTPSNAQGNIFNIDCRPGEISGPDGPGAALPITGWTNTTCNPRGIGEYLIAINGGAIMSGLSFDIRPNSCPNPFNPTSTGNIPVSILGSAGFDVNVAVASSISISRADAVGGEVPVLANSASYEDKGAPYLFFGWCGCAMLGFDLVEDLNIRFSTQQLAKMLHLDDEPGGSFVELVVKGQFQSGALFSASDCVWIVPPHLYSEYEFPEDYEPLP